MLLSLASCEGNVGDYVLWFEFVCTLDGNEFLSMLYLSVRVRESLKYIYMD